MKTMVTWLLLLGLLASCSNTRNDQHTVLLHDISNPDRIQSPSLLTVKTLFDFEDDPYQRVSFAYRRLTGRSYTRRIQTELHKELRLFSNRIKRQVTIDEFFSQIEMGLNEPIDSLGTKESSIWIPLVEEIQLAQKDTVRPTIIYLFSDLEFNSDFFSVHKSSDMRLLQTSYESVVKQFTDYGTNQRIQGANVGIVVVYEPSSIEDDKRYTVMRNLWLDIFKRLDIPIEFKTNL